MATRIAASSFALCVALLLTACGKTGQAPADKAVGAQVLPGSISDAMLNLDQSRSHPLLQPPPRAVNPVAISASDAPTDAAPDEAAKPEPAAPGN